jgi:hypothetical protein
MRSVLLVIILFLTINCKPQAPGDSALYAKWAFRFKQDSLLDLYLNPLVGHFCYDTTFINNSVWQKRILIGLSSGNLGVDSIKKFRILK